MPRSNHSLNLSNLLHTDPPEPFANDKHALKNLHQQEENSAFPSIPNQDELELHKAPNPVPFD